ncbi:hypothetical protein JR316_0009194 [Psilocybe cubensis]|uniref:Uncharacterized protein n=2 Tax=Psilocybe cubensis TaxID=181762 RepID=A0ACB8GT15_PSICU|nr:hypothetical protein JR316_0009194 [Psilocybe cubensis]KAH9478734.1 hypothetical protein JR316_0009194 [Psilocybe cubensis]
MIYLPGKTDKLEEQDVADNVEIATKKIASGPATESKSVEITEPRVRGVLNDFDMAVVLGPDGKPTTPSTGDHHITGTLPFMAGDLLMTPEDRAKFQLKYPTIPTYHLYRHDLESFFYILVWAATRYDLKKGCRLRLLPGSPLIGWSNTPNVLNTVQIKALTIPLMDRLENGILAEWKGLWVDWIQPLFLLFMEGLRFSQAAQTHGNIDDFTTGGGLLTFEKFMATIKVTPRNFDTKK